MIVGQPTEVNPHCLADRVPVVLVCTNTGSWGSGVLVDQTHGIVLTCSHVVNSASQGQRVYHVLLCSLVHGWYYDSFSLNNYAVS